MLIGLCGPAGAGKRTVAKFLRTELGFIVVSSPASQVDRSNASASEDCSSADIHDAISPNLWTQCWRRDINVVIENISLHDASFDELLKRPYFLPIYVTAPILTRFRRVAESTATAPSLSEFVEKEDVAIHCKATGNQGSTPILFGDTAYSLSDMERMCRIRILNNFCSVQELYEHLHQLDIPNPERLRPCWDTYFMSLAMLASQRTNCMKRRVGCVIVKNHRIVATGYNGTPSQVKNCLDGGCGRCNGSSSKQGVGLDLCLCLHAEENAIIEAGRERCQGGTLYTNLFPCILCAKKIIQAGIRNVVYSTSYATDGVSEELLTAGGVLVQAHRAILPLGELIGQ